MNKTIILIMFLVFVISVQAQSDAPEYVFKLGNETSISRPCFTSGATGYCDATARCIISVFDPDNNIVVLGASMSNLNYTHNITLPLLTKAGIYKCDMACSQNNLTGSDTFFFAMNNAGQNYNGSSGTYFLLGIVILFMIIFAIASYFLDNALKVVFLFMTFLMLPVTLWVSLDIARNTFMSLGLINVLSTCFVLSLICFGGFVLYIFITLFMQLKIKKTISIQKQPGNPSYWNRRQESKKRRQGEEYQ